MAKLVIQKLSEPQAEFNGWIVESFPSTEAQLKMMLDASKAPKIMVYRDFELKNSLDRCGQYRWDPEELKTVRVKDSFVTPE